MKDERGYQLEYSNLNPEMYAEAGRRRKAETMRLVLQHAMGDRLMSARVLNIGCSAGLIDGHLAPHVGSVVGIDIDRPGVSAAQSRNERANVSFLLADAMSIPVSDESFDVVICSQVYEHVPSASTLMDEIKRVLKVGGVCYFAATNRWSVMEHHYQLPFLSWLPAKLGDLYVRALGRSDRYYERHFGVPTLRRLASPLVVDDWTGRILSDPGRYSASYMFPRKWHLIAARAAYRFAYWFFPGFIWLLWKRPEEATRLGHEC